MRAAGSAEDRAKDGQRHEQAVSDERGIPRRVEAGIDGRGGGRHDQQRTRGESGIHFAGAFTVSVAGVQTIPRLRIGGSGGF